MLLIMYREYRSMSMYRWRSEMKLPKLHLVRIAYGLYVYINCTELLHYIIQEDDYYSK